MKMSAVNQTQTNGKKSGGSSSSSAVNTPTPTPVSNTTNGQNTVQSSPPPNNNAPKYGTLVPNRVFVGGISANTTEGELLQLFSNYGTVKAAKIIQDRAGVSKGYGFITFESEDDAKRLQREADSIILRERKLNIAPAIKKQSFGRAFDASSPPAVAAGNTPYYFQPGAAMPFFQGGMAYYPQPGGAPTDPNTAQPTAAVYQPPPVYPTQSAPPQTAAYPSVMFPQPIYMPQQYPMPVPYEYNYYPTNGGPQYVVGNQNGPQPQGPPMQPPGSPPRPTCYNQQLPYNPDPALYYNIPMYGPIEGPPLYPDPLDIASNGPYVEEPYAAVDDSAQDVAPPPLNHYNFATTETQQQQQLRNTSTENTAITTDTTRQSNTPVVSLLSLDQKHEKDFTSMQSGRRRKSTPSVQSTPPPPPQYHANGYINNVFPANFVNSVGFYPPPNSFAVNQQFECGYGGRPNSRGGAMNGGRSWSRRRRIPDARNTETCSLSSMRSDSNSPASVVDENRNEDKVQRTGVSSPPPAPYSPITYYGYTGSDKTRGCYDSLHRARNNNNNKRAWNVTRRHSDNVIFNKIDVGAENEEVNSNSFVTQQVVSAGGAQHFAPPSRSSRNRRNTARRNTNALSEIGAGDAPLPAPEVSDACKKLDGLKL